jgi:hypothetical protein
LNLLALLVALLAQHAYPPKARQPLAAFYGRMCLSAAKRLDAGDRNSGIVAWGALMVGVLVPVALATAAARALHPFVEWILDIVVLYATLRFLRTVGELAAIERSLREGDVAAASSRLAQWQGAAAVADDAGSPRSTRCARRTRASSRRSSGTCCFPAPSGSCSIRSRCARRRAGSTWWIRTRAISAGSRRAPST